MTRIETIFGGVLAAGVLAVFAFVFFGHGTLSVAQTAPGESLRVNPAAASRLFANPEEYVPPSTHCDCYNYAYDFARAGLSPASVDYESQLTVCYERLGPLGAAAFERGYTDFAGDTRRRKACPVQDFL